MAKQPPPCEHCGCPQELHVKHSVEFDQYYGACSRHPNCPGYTADSGRGHSAPTTSRGPELTRSLSPMVADGTHTSTVFDSRTGTWTIYVNGEQVEAGIQTQEEANERAKSY